MTVLDEKIEILKEKIKSKEPSVQRQSIRSFVTLCQQQNNSNATRIIMKTLYGFIHHESITVSTATIDAILTLCKLGLADVDKLSSSLTRYAINIHIQVLPYLTRGLMNVLLYKLQSEKSKDAHTFGEVLVTLVQNRPECMPELISQLPQLLVTKNDTKMSFNKVIKFVSPFFTHVFTSRRLLQLNITSTNTPSFIQQQEEDVQKNTQSTSNFAANAVRLQLVRELIKVSLQLKRQKQLEYTFIVVSYLLHFVPCFNIDPADVTTSCIAPCSELMDLLLILYNDRLFKQFESEIGDMVSILFSHLFSLLEDMKRQRVDNESCFSELVRLLELEPGQLVQFAPLICSHILSAATELELNAYVALLGNIIDYITESTEQFYEFYVNCSKIHTIREASFFSVLISTLLTSIGPLLGVLSTASEIIQQMASAILSKVESYLSKLDTVEQKQFWQKRQSANQTISSDSQVISHLSSIEPLFLRGSVSILRFHYALIGRLFDGSTTLLNCKYAHHWIEGLLTNFREHDENNGYVEAPDYTCILLGLVLVASRSNYNTVEQKAIIDVRLRTCDVIQQICQVFDPVRCGLFFQPLFMFELSREHNADARLKVLVVIPKLGTKNFLCVSPVVRLLSSMLSQPSLTSIILRLLTELWKENDRLFPKLKTALLDKSEYQSETTEIDAQRLSRFDIETRISIAASINTVCEFNPKRGLDLAALLCKLLCQDNHPTVLGYGLQALYHLCWNEQLEFGTIWFKLISSNILENSRRHNSVLTHMCKLLRFGVKPDNVDPESLLEEEKKLRDEKEEDEYNLFLDFEPANKEDAKVLMEMLWDFTQHKDEKVREAAFQSLAQYPLRAHLFVLKKQEEPAEEDEEKKEEGMFAQQEKRKLLLLEFGKLIMNKISTETSELVRVQIRKLIAMILRAELRNPQGLKKTSYQSIPTVAVTHTVLDVITGLRLHLSGELTKKSVIDPVISAIRLWNPIGTSVHRSAAEAYQRAMSDMIMDINIGGSAEDFYAHFLLTEGFFTLMNRYYQAQVLEEDQDKRSTQRSFDIAFDKIFTLLKTTIEKSSVPSNTENAILALSGLCVGLPSHAHHHVEKAIGLLKDVIASEPQEWVLFACNIALAAVCYELHVPTQIIDVAEALLSQLDGFETSDTINPASASVALGLIAKNLCIAESSTSYTDSEKTLLVRIVSKLHSLCFSSSLKFKHNQTAPSKGTNSLASYDWKQATNLLLGLSLAAGGLTRIEELEALDTIYNDILAEVKRVQDSINSPNISAVHSSILVLPQLLLAKYVANTATLNEVLSVVDLLKQLIQQTENKALPALNKIYSNASIALSTSLFSIFCQARLEDNSDADELQKQYQEYFDALITTLESNQSLNATTKVGLLCALSSALGLNLFVPSELSATATADSLGIGDHSTTKQDIAFITTRHRSVFSSLLQNENASKNLAPLVQKAIALLKKIYSTKTSMDTKVRKFTSYLVGSLSELYSSDAEDASEYVESEVRIHMQYLNENGLAMHFIELLTNAPDTLQNATLQDNVVAALNIKIALETLLANEALPRIVWSRIIQNLLKAVSGCKAVNPAEVELKTYLKKLCFRMLCKDAESATAKSTSLKLLSSICEKANFQNLSRELQDELCENLFPQLVNLFPSVRTCSFITDLMNLSFAQYPPQLYVTRALGTLKDEHCTDQTIAAHLKKVLSETQQSIFGIVSSQAQAPFIELTNSVIKSNKRSKQGFTLNALDVRIVNELAACLSRMPKQFSRDFLSNTQTTFDLMLNCLMAWNENNLNQEAISPSMKPVRQVCMKSTTNAFTNQIFSEIMGELISMTMTNANAAKWLEESVDLISFVLSEQLSPLQQALAMTQNIGKHPSQIADMNTELHLENALNFIAHLSMCSNTKDLYILYFACDHIIPRCLNSEAKFIRGEMEQNYSLLVHSLAIALVKGKLAEKEKSLLSRLFALLNSHPTQSIVFSFIIPLLISINNKKQVGWAAYQQIGHSVEKKALALTQLILSSVVTTQKQV